MIPLQLISSQPPSNLCGPNSKPQLPQQLTNMYRLKCIRIRKVGKNITDAFSSRDMPSDPQVYKQEIPQAPDVRAIWTHARSCEDCKVPWSYTHGHHKWATQLPKSLRTWIPQAKHVPLHRQNWRTDTRRPRPTCSQLCSRR